jgi:hypothetical protein
LVDHCRYFFGHSTTKIIKSHHKDNEAIGSTTMGQRKMYPKPQIHTAEKPSSSSGIGHQLSSPHAQVSKMHFLLSSENINATSNTSTRKGQMSKFGN